MPMAKPTFRNTLAGRLLSNAPQPPKMGSAIFRYQYQVWLQCSECLINKPGGYCHGQNIYIRGFSSVQRLLLIHYCIFSGLELGHKS